MKHRLRRPSSNKHSQGFTLIELLLVIGIIAILTGLTFINLGRPQQEASLSTIADTLVSDLKSQQLLAMSGNKGSASVEQPQGVYIQSGTYTLFAGTSYSNTDTNNFAVTIDPSITLTTTFPSSQVLFTKGTGAVQSWANTTDTITISNTTLGTSKIITIGRFGAIDVN